MSDKDYGAIYKIENMENGKMYIGCSVYFNRRRHQHLSSLKNNQHHNQSLQDDFNKYGEDVFVFVPMVIVEGILPPYQSEKAIIAKYREDGFSLYNHLLVKKTTFLGKETLQPLDVDIDIPELRKQLEAKP